MYEPNEEIGEGVISNNWILKRGTMETWPGRPAPCDTRKTTGCDGSSCHYSQF